MRKNRIYLVLSVFLVGKNPFLGIPVFKFLKIVPQKRSIAVRTGTDFINKRINASESGRRFKRTVQIVRKVSGNHTSVSAEHNFPVKTFLTYRTNTFFF